jgi:hypothetical protein
VIALICAVAAARINLGAAPRRILYERHLACDGGVEAARRQIHKPRIPLNLKANAAIG